MTDQESHIEQLKRLATLECGSYEMGGFLVKVSANDVIAAGKRLEELGIFKFDVKTDNQIIIKIVK